MTKEAAAAEAKRLEEMGSLGGLQSLPDGVRRTSTIEAEEEEAEEQKAEAEVSYTMREDGLAVNEQGEPLPPTPSYVASAD